MKRSAMSRPRISEGLAEMALVGGSQGRVSHETKQALQREVYRKVQIPGSIDFVEDPRPDEAGIAVVIMVSGGDRLLRVALGRNRCASLISELVKAMI